VTSLEPLMRQNFLEYASYVIVDRAIPDLRDGLKPVQRRILATLKTLDDGKLHKVAGVIGDTMKLHPHGDASIGDALVVLANKEYFIERQGNFGSPITGHPAAAARYIECRLTPLARETLFNDELTEKVPSYDGRREEPVALPAKLPVALLLGAEGIAVGLATRILPHNLAELLEAQIQLLRKKHVKLVPDFPNGGLADVSDYQDGRGKVKVRARLETPDDKTIVVREVAYGTTTESLIASIEAAAQKGKIKLQSIQDLTTDKVEIRIELPRGVHAEETVPQLYAWTDCEITLQSSLILIQDRRPVETTVTEVLAACTARLKDILKAELEHELQRLTDRRHWLTLERVFIENRVYKKIESAKTQEAVTRAVWDGMEPFKKQFVRAMVDADVERLLEIRIRRISAYDIAKNQAEVEGIVAAIGAAEKKLGNMVKTTVAWLEDMLDRHGKDWPRRTELATFEAVDKRAVARENLRLAYDPESGFFGTAVRGEGFPLTVSEFARILIVSKDGSYRIVEPPDKLLVPGKALWISVFDPAVGQRFTVVYRDKEKRCFGKRVHIQAFIKGKEYALVPGGEGAVDLLLTDDKPGRLHLAFAPAKYQRVTEAEFDLDTLEPTSVGARGVRLAPKPVRTIKRLKDDAPGAS
jgi:topoisomerase-4 subunit A